ncbi:hypothetical protein N781_06740 [Pontibacillus halophilus JSM 076056 = DSM 19796]|uniref:RDD domain-containing protein n=1 Tax=Pontibacillus halophilus JSM 076056 = DSM 19796 TaxID=1385510 RepID=A0A0A5GFI2_9BACI|nr:RDD family protein [Pontibacillus halophilus]KGX90769.1 hypothetical protein N781_06740 [Pontibacillus halophilus JSM 076056 = DSM 19796]
MNDAVGFPKRLGAFLIDRILLIVVGSILGALIPFISSLTDVLYAVLVPALWYGYTVGKRALGVRILRMDGSNPGFGTTLTRAIVGGVIYFLPVIAAIIYGFLSIDVTALINELNQVAASMTPNETFALNQDEAVAFTIFGFSMLASLLILIISALMVGFRKDHRSLHDLVARTYVSDLKPGETIEEQKYLLGYAKNLA